MNHTMRQPPLELGRDVNGNRWLTEHRDGMRLVAADWDAFRDPDSVTYGSYTADQDDAETYVERLLERFDVEGHDEQLTEPALDLVQRAMTPCRYLGHGEQMLSAYVQQLAPGSFIATAATFQTADQLRRVQWLAYRTTQLARSRPDRGFGGSERSAWETAPAWQPMREAVERAMVEYDWDRAVVATQLVVKPLADVLFLKLLARQLAAVGATLDALILENLWQDAERSQRFTVALVRFLVDANLGNASVLQEYLDAWIPLGLRAIAAGGALLATDPRDAESIAAGATRLWSELVERAGLTLSAGRAVAGSTA
jgi:toluene monooxygenase system protein E